jgi:3-methyladenine DNA glycosylase AlkD
MSKPSQKQRDSARAARPLPDAAAVVASLKELATEAALAGMARYAIPSERAFGVSMSSVQSLAKRLGRSHELAADLWASGWYEARLLASYVDEPARVTPGQMDRWCDDFDNWAVCDTVCFALFDRTPHAWSKVEQWSHREEEFGRRAAFALLWGLSVHDKGASDEQFSRALRLVELAAADERHFVKKAVNMALRAVGKRNLALHGAALAVAERLAASPHAAPRWVGKDARRELASPAVLQRLAT